MYSSSLIISIYCFVLLIGLSSCLNIFNLNETDLNAFNIIDLEVIICKSFKDKKWSNIFAKSYFKVDNATAIKNVHTGFDLEQVKQQMSKWFSSYNYLRLFLNSSTITIPLYSDYCVGIESTKPYKLSYHFNNFDYTNFILFILGIVLFYSANYLSKKIYIYYATHVTIGVIGSLLILTLILHKFLPRRIYAFFVFSSFFMNTYFVVKIKEYLFTYPFGLYLISYILVAAIISFIFAYYRGPIKNHRLFDLFKWFLQFCALLFIFISSEYTELILFIMALILLKYNLPSFIQLRNNLIKNYRYYFPKPRKLLTLEEYEQESQFYTEKALEELRSFCKSPKFDKWRAMKKMQNASRFAGFIDGEDHISDSEVFEHISRISLNDSQMTDDDSDESIGFY